MAEVVEAPVVVPLTEEQATLKRVIQTSLHRSLLAKGVHEVCKAIESKEAKFVILADDCTEASYKQLVVALAKQFQIPVWRIEKGETLGDYIGLCKFLNLQKKIKTRKCSSVVIKDYAIEISENERNLIEDKLKTL